MNLDPRKSEYSLVSHSPIKHAESQTLHDEVEAFLAKGGEIENLSNKVASTFVSSHFNKSKEQLAATARKNRRTLFLHHCSHHFLLYSDYHTSFLVLVYIYLFGRQLVQHMYFFQPI